MRKYLLHKDIIVAEIDFSTEKDETATPATITEVYNEEHMPPGIETGPAAWNQKRCMPDNRPNADLLRQEAGVETVSDLVAFSHMASLTDCYWFATEQELDDGLSWKDVNFFDNMPASMLSDLVFRGNNECELTNFDSPDLTTNGVHPKTWIHDEEAWWLVKGEDFPQREMEAGKKLIETHQTFSELLASVIAEELNISHVDYYFSFIDNKPYAMCRNMIKDDSEEMIELHYYQKNNDFDIFSFDQFIDDNNLRDDLNKLRILDYVTNNADRHMGNIGIIRDTENLQIKRLAPVYDNGESFQYSIYANMPLQTQRSRLTQAPLNEGISQCVKSLDKTSIDIDKVVISAEVLGEQLGIEEPFLSAVKSALKERLGVVQRELDARNKAANLMNNIMGGRFSSFFSEER